MKLAYLIVAHQNPDQLAILVHTLLVETNHIFVHIDAGSEADFSALYALEETDSRLHILEDQFRVNWGGFNLTLAVISLLNACNQYETTFDYIFTLSGQDFPLVSNSHINAYLHQHQGTEFVEYHALPFEGWNYGGLDRIEYYWLIDEIGFSNSAAFVETQRAEGVKRIPPDRLATHGGSCWMTITSGLMKYICETIQRDWAIIYPYFKYTLISDEILIQSIILHSPFAGKIVNNNLRYIDWYSGPGFPKTLTLSDLDAAFDSGRLFARKINTNSDNDIIENIKNRMSLC